MRDGMRSGMRSGMRHGMQGARRRSVRGAVTVVGLPLALAACASTPVSCTQIGCSSGISVTVEGFHVSPTDAVDVHACLGSVCHDRAVTDEPAVVFIESDADAQVASAIATVRVTRAGATLVQVRREFTLHKIVPNGEQCGPVCFVAFAVVSPTGLRPA